MNILELLIYIALIILPFLICTITDCFDKDKKMIYFLFKFIPCILIILFINYIFIFS